MGAFRDAIFLDIGQIVGQSPILGGDTSVTLSSASVLQSLGVSVTPLGTASVDTSGASPIAEFPITGGTAGSDGNDVILHQGSGLELADQTGTIDLSNFRIDTQNSQVDALVATNGQSDGVLPVFDLGAQGTLTLTQAAAQAVDTTLGTTAITPETMIGSASPAPITDLGSLPNGQGADPVAPVIGGITAVTLSAAGALQAAGVQVAPLGLSFISTSGAVPVADFLITGGSVGGDSGTVLLHQGSGLELSDTAGTVDLSDFLIDVKDQAVFANVSANGASLGNAQVFDLGSGNSLSLTTVAAQALDQTLGASLAAGTTIGTASPMPVVLHG